MAGVAGGKFCMHCNKTVIDFTTWGDTALYNFFSASQGEVCGTFLNTQLGRSLQVRPVAHSALYRVAAAVGFTILLAQATGNKAFARPPYASAYYSPIIHGEDAIPVDSTILRGHITSDNVPVSGALVQLFQHGSLAVTTIADTMGYYSVTIPSAGTYRLVVSKPQASPGPACVVYITANNWPEYPTYEKEIAITEQKINIEDVSLLHMVQNPSLFQPAKVTSGGVVIPFVETTTVVFRPRKAINQRKTKKK